MKAAMTRHLDIVRYTMFQESAENVRIRLHDTVKNIEVLMADKTDEVFTQMRRDYRSVLGGGEAPQEGEILPREQRAARKEVIKIIDGIVEIFEKVAGRCAEDDCEDNEENSDPASDGEGTRGDEIDIKEDDQGANVKRETKSSDRFMDDHEEPPKATPSKLKHSANESTAPNDESETKSPN